RVRPHRSPRVTSWLCATSPPARRSSNTTCPSAWQPATSVRVSGCICTTAAAAWMNAPRRWIRTREPRRIHAMSDTPLSSREWQGYLRPDGRKGVRNLVLVIYTVECAQHVAHAIAAGEEDTH